MNLVPAEFEDLLKDETRAFIFLCTVMKDGWPQVTPVWFNTGGDMILINSARGRVKDRNMRRNPRVTLCIQDPSNPYRYLQVKGRIIEITGLGADEHIDILSRKYLGLENYPYRQAGEVRVLYRVKPLRVDAHG